MMSPLVRPHESCRVCGTALPEPYLDLGQQPLANALVNPRDNSRAHTFPLAITRCPTCSLSQLTVVVDPDVLYADYPFRGGLSPVWQAHCEELADACGVQGVVLDIACNDGTQLRAFHERGWHCIGVDPAPATTEFPIIKGFWDHDTARKYLALYPPADIVIAQNVLGHVDAPVEFLVAAQFVLTPHGSIVVEVPDADRMIADGEFDTIYHEHLSYWTYPALQVAAYRAGLEIMFFEPLPIHGGSLRVWMAPARPLADFSRSVEARLSEIARLLPTLGRLVGYGAAAKATVLLNALAQREDSIMPEAVIDDTPEKQGLQIPGVRVPIIACPDSLADVDILWLLSWNNADTLQAKARARGFTGRFLLTVPEVTLLEE